MLLKFTSHFVICLQIFVSMLTSLNFYTRFEHKPAVLCLMCSEVLLYIYSCKGGKCTFPAAAPAAAPSLSFRFVLEELVCTLDPPLQWLLHAGHLRCYKLGHTCINATRIPLVQICRVGPLCLIFTDLIRKNFSFLLICVVFLSEEV